MLIISLIVSFIALVAGSFALYLQLRDVPRIRIVSIHVGLSGTGHTRDPKRWEHKVSSISVDVVNTGRRPALRCAGVVSFSKLDALPLYPTKGGEMVFNDTFDILPTDKIHLVAAFSYSGNAIGTQSLSVGEFIEKAPPVKATITFGNQKVTRELSTKEIKEYIRKHQEESYLRDRI